MNEKNTFKDASLKLKRAILEADYKSAAGLAREALESGAPADVLMQESIVAGIGELEKQLFGENKVTVHPDFLMAAESARLALDVLLQEQPEMNRQPLGRVVMGVPAGDTHDLGAKIVAIALTAAGFDVAYLGHDVPVSQFIEKIIETEATILAISSYQTTGFDKIRMILKMLEEAGLSEKVNVMVGGSVITDKFTESLNIGYAKTAGGAVELALQYAGGAQ